MIATVFLCCLIGLTAAQYGHGGSGYGPDGVRNRYFILGHGRGPISTSIGSGIYGTSLGLARSSYRPSRGHSDDSYGSSGHASAPAYQAPAPVYHAPAPVYRAPAPVYHAPAPVYHAPAPAPVYHAPAPVYRAPAPVYHAPAPAYSAPAVDHGLYGPSANQGYGGGYGGSSYGGGYGGSSYGHHDDLAQPTPYDFGYNSHNEHGDQLSRQESGDGHGNVKGSYGYRDSYGIFRHVDYVADHHGFRANVRTNEPGTAPQDPADVKMNVEHGGYGY